MCSKWVAPDLQGIWLQKYWPESHATIWKLMFSVVLWEVSALVKPYAFARSRDMLVDHVCKYNTESIYLHALFLLDVFLIICIHSLSSGWWSSRYKRSMAFVKDLLRMGFDALREEHTSMRFVFDVIWAELCKMSNGDIAQIFRPCFSCGGIC